MTTLGYSELDNTLAPLIAEFPTAKEVSETSNALSRNLYRYLGDHLPTVQDQRRHRSFLTFIADTGMGNAAHRVAEGKRCVTISLEMKFISAGKPKDNLVAKVKVQKKTKTLVFLTCEIINSEGIVAVTSGVWKILKINK